MTVPQYNFPEGMHPGANEPAPKSVILSERM